MWTSALLWAVAGLSLAAGAPQHEKRTLLLKELAKAPLNPLNFELTKVGLTCDRANSTVSYSCNVKFNWYDPNSVRRNDVNSGSCNQIFSWDGVHPIGSEDGFGGDSSVVCWEEGPSYFDSTLVHFADPGNFTLRLSHRFFDDENFTAPFVYPTIYALPNIALPLVAQNETKITRFHEGLIIAPFEGLAL